MSEGCGCSAILETASKTTSCECAVPDGDTQVYCARHKCRKTGHFVRLCQSNPAYHQLWEQGQGPCLGGALPTPPGRVGLGDMIHRVLSAMGVTPKRLTALLGRDCGCDGRKQWLNRVTVWGWWR